MSNDNITTITDQQTITSMEIAEATGKLHKNILKAIRAMEPAWEIVTGLKFEPCKRTYEIGNGVTRSVPMYVFTKREAAFIVTKFNDEMRAKLLLRWEWLENEIRSLASPQPKPAGKGEWYKQGKARWKPDMPADPRNMSRLQILQLALQAEEENERLRLEKKELEDEKSSLEADNYGLMIGLGQKDQEIQQLQERTAYLNVIMSDRTSVTASQIAQDYGKTAVSFNKLLNGLRIQRKIGEQWVLYSDYINRGYVSTRMVPIHHQGQPDTFKPLTAWTQLGRKFLYERLKKEGILPLIERNQLQAAAQEGGASC